MRHLLIVLLLLLATSCDSQGPAADTPQKPEIEDVSPSWQFTGCSTVRETNHTLLFTGNSLDAFIGGDTVYAFTQDSLCAGKSGTFGGKSFAISAWGDDSQTQTKDGFAPGEAYILVLRSARYPAPVTLIPTEIENMLTPTEEGPLKYVPNEITKIIGLRQE